MLDLPFSRILCYRSLSKILFLGSFSLSQLGAVEFVQATPCVSQVNSSIIFFEQEWTSRYLHSVDENTSLDEVIDFLLALRGSLVSKGYQPMALSELCLQMSDYFIEQSIAIDADEVEEIFQKIVEKEAIVSPESFQYAVNSSKNFRATEVKSKKKKNKEAKMGSKGIFGFVKALAGGLLCIVPVPVVQGVGVALVADGIKDMVDGAREQGDDNERLQKMDEQRRKEAREGSNN